MTQSSKRLGYKRPPTHTQFKPGQSGNPKGRPKGTKNLRTDLAEELAEQITVTEGGQQIQVSKQRAMLKAMLAKALKGDSSAARTLVNLIVGLEQADSQQRRPDSLGEDDLEVVAALAARLADRGKVDDS